MSLLLDALKKAAQEKQKAGAKHDQQTDTPGAPAPNAEDQQAAAETANSNDANSKQELELSLDDDSTSAPSSATQADDTELTLSDAPELELEKTTATTSTVSNEAMQLLVYKTNKRHRRTQKILWGSIVSGAFLILAVGGVSYYYGMLQDVEALERKHKIAMRVVQSQPVTRPHILQSMQQEIAEKENAEQKKKPVKASLQAQSRPQVQTVSPVQQQRRDVSTLSIQKTEKRDPVNALLNTAWQAYSEQDYVTAKKIYGDVLKREPNNRDALLGDAAIAVKQANFERARAAYSLLLKLDPRDPIAIAGLSGLEQAAPDSLSESKLKFMLRQQPDAAHLHFALGNLYAKQKKWPQAQGEYFNAWTFDNDNADYVFNLAVSLDRIGEYQEARRFYENSLSLAPGKNINFSTDAVKKRIAQLVAK